MRRLRYKFARGLRERQTDAEKHLWWHLRNRQVGGHKFRRQQPVGTYVVDFVCMERRMIVELDGGQHQLQEAEILYALNFWSAKDSQYCASGTIKC